MPKTDVLGASRDGDFFHYYWAARRALELLIPGTDLVAIAIERAAPDETANPSDAGEDLIDVAEYYQATTLEDGGRVVYRQLKHSTFQSEIPWNMSGLKRTLAGFAARFKDLKQRSAPAHEAATFEFVSNRIVAEGVLRAIEDVATESTPRDPKAVALLRQYIALDDEEAAEFCQKFSVDTRAPSLLSLMRQFELDVARFLPEADSDAATRVKEAVAKRATTLDDSLLTRVQILALFGIPEDQYYPAPAQFEAPAQLMHRACYDELGGWIVDTPEPMIIHASGGVGKSVFAQSLPAYLPAESVVVTYDCYGLGSYRRATGYRHGHRQGLVQIVNELAAKSLCDPLLSIPSGGAAAYSRVFAARIAEAALRVRPGLLVIAIDAADNAAMAAEQVDGSRPFVADLLREVFPDNVRVVMLCRTERIYRLDPPANVPKYPMPSLDAGESKERLEQRFGTVSELDALEFHKKTAGNGRVQDAAMSESTDVVSCLSLLGEGYKSADSALDELLDKNFAHVLDEHGSDSPKIEAISRVLATLRPRIPLDVIGDLADAPQELVLSFVSDLGRPLLIQGDAVQFRDEPTESWFRTRFEAKGAAVRGMVEKLRFLAARDAYAATALPQLLWESGQLGELVELALSVDALPATNNIERREIDEHRVQFAMKACLRAGRNSDGAKLAVKAGELAAGRSRHVAMIRANTDLAGEFLDQKTTEELIATRALRQGWPGSNLAYEGALMSYNVASQEDARNRLRSAEEWMVGWSRAADAQSGREGIKREDIAEIAQGRLNVEGPAACLQFLERWRRPQTAFDVGKLVARRLFERGDLSKLNALLAEAKSNKYLQLAIAGEAMQHYVHLDSEGSRSISTMLKRHTKPIDFGERWDSGKEQLAAVSGAVIASLRSGKMTRSEGAKVLGLYLPAGPPRSLAQRPIGEADPTLRALALRAYCEGVELAPEHVAPSKVLEELDGKSHVSTRDGREYREEILPLLPWVQAWVRVVCDPASEPSRELEALIGSLPTPRKYVDYSPKLHLNMAARIAAALVAAGASEASESMLRAWVLKVSQDIWLESGWFVIRLLARQNGWDDTLFDLAKALAGRATQDPEDAQFRVDSLLGLARATRALSGDEAQHYFGEAVAIAEKLGDEAYTRWESTLAVAHRAAGPQPDDDRAFRLARMAEAIRPYLGDAGDAHRLVVALGRLSPPAAPAIVSRWRDRHFGQFGSLVASLVDPDEQLPTLDSRVAIALTALDDRMSKYEKLALAATVSFPAIAAEIAHVGADYRRQRGLPTTPDPVDHSRQDETSAGWPEPSPERERRGAKALRKLKGLDYAVADGLSAAIRLVRAEPVNMEQLVAAAFDRPKRGWAAVVRNFMHNSSMSMWDYRTLFQHVDTLEGRPGGMRDALASLATALAHRFSEDLATARWDALPWDAVQRTSGVARAYLVSIALRDLGSLNGFLDADASYGLLKNLTATLDQSDAEALFDHIEESSRYLIEDGAPEREWTAALSPPAHVPGSIAGLIWSALGDPDEAIRWRAAHTVRILCRLGCVDELRALNDVATEGVAPAFTDSRFVFYRDDAMLWLLVALDRATIDDPAPVGEFLGLFGLLAESDADHALIAHHLESVLRSLGRAPHPTTAAAAEAILATRTWSPLNPVEVHYSERVSEPDFDDDVGGEYQVHYDFRDEWLSPLARCFGADPSELESRVSSLIDQSWNGRFVGDNDEDVRWTANVFKQGEMLTRYADSPRVHDLDSYLTFHAVMRVAGTLASTVPAYKDPESESDDYSDWISMRGLTRPDGRWLSDRRDATPRDRRELKPASSKRDTWRWAIQRKDLSEALTSSTPGVINVWEYAERNERDRSQHISIESALVAPTRADALVLSLQTAPRFSGFKIPSVDDELEVEEGEYVLRGWIANDSRDPRLDRSDPFSGGIAFPPPHPSYESQDLLAIAPDPDLRCWSTAGPDVSPAIVVTSWNDQGRERDGRREGSRGSRVQIAGEALDEMLSKLNANLIVSVSMDRKTYDYSGRDEDPSSYEMGYMDDYFKIFLYKPHVGWFDLHGPLSFGEAAGS